MSDTAIKKPSYQIKFRKETYDKIKEANKLDRIKMDRFVSLQETIDWILKK